MSSLFLTADELFELTGAKIKSKQIKVLRKNRIAFHERSNGVPVVMRATFLQPASQAQTDAKPQPRLNRI